MTTADVVVIGGGIAGISAAAEIAAEARVVVLERERQTGYHTTGRSAAMYIAGYGNAVIRALNARSRPAFEHADPAFWPEPLLSRRGMVMLGRPGQEALVAAEAGSGGTMIDAATACGLVPILDPDTIACGFHDPEAADIDVDLLLQGFAKLLRRRGGRIETDAEAGAIARDGGLWRVTTRAGAVAAPLLVNAAGAWADVVAGRAGVAALGLQPLRRSAAILPPPAGHDIARWPMFGGIAEDWYAKPTGGRLLVSPADEDPVPPQDAWPDDMVIAEGLARFEAMTRVAVTRVERTWAGLRSFLPDRTPAAGFDPVAPGFLWLAGQGGYGIQTAPALARLAADLVLGRTPALSPSVIARLEPGRARSGTA